MLPRKSNRLAVNTVEHQDPDTKPQPLQIVFPIKGERTKKKTKCEIVKAYIDRMKENDPEKHKMYKENCRQSSKSHRDNMSAEQKAIEREKSRIRMQASRERRKAQPQTQPPKTRAAQEEQRAKWREEKSRQKDKMHPQKLWRVNERRRHKYKERQEAKAASKKAANQMSTATRQCQSETEIVKKEIKKAANQMSTATCQCQSETEIVEKEIKVETDDCQITLVADWSENLLEPTTSSASQSQTVSLADKRTPEARRKAAGRVKSLLPKSPSKFVGTVSDVIERASPRKKKLICQKLELVETPAFKVEQNIKEKLKALGNTKEDRKTRELLLSLLQY